MKIGLKIVAALFVAFMVVGCGGSDGKDDPTPPPAPPASADGWMLSKMNGSSSVSGKVYLQLNQDKTFSMYQSIENPGYTKFTGTYKLESKILSGTYSGGTPWKNEYEVVTQNGSTMTLKASTDAVVYDYVAVEIPGYVKDGITIMSAEQGEEVPFL